jgi:RNAse (barnase) inhibitor barstar
MEYRIDCTNLESAKALHRRIADCLSLPEWYGHNLDALYDCLTEIGAPTHLVLVGWDDNLPFSPGFRSVFEDAQLDNPAISVTFE